MPRALLPRDELRRIIRRRRDTGASRWDEVWDGIYVVSPNPDNEHQGLAGVLVAVLLQAVGARPGVRVYPSINISDRETRWRRNFRCPDASVFLPGNPAQDRGSHWLGGPDFAVEILSPGDRARRKLPFYAKVGVRELLLIDRKPWRLELYRRDGDRLDLVGTAGVGDPDPIASDVLSLSLRLLPGDERPIVELVRSDRTRWLA